MTGIIVESGEKGISFIVDKEKRIIGATIGKRYLTISDIYKYPHIHELLHTFEKKLFEGTYDNTV